MQELKAQLGAVDKNESKKRDQATRQIEELTRFNETIVEKLDAVESEHQRALEKLTQKSTQRITSTTQQLERLQTEHSSVQQRISQLDRQKSELSEQNSELENTVAELLTRSEALQSKQAELKQLESERVKLSDTLERDRNQHALAQKESNRELERTRSELQKAQSSLSNLSKELQQRKQESEQAVRDHRGVTADLNVTTRRLDALQQKLERREITIASHKIVEEKLQKLQQQNLKTRNPRRPRPQILPSPSRKQICLAVLHRRNQRLRRTIASRSSKFHVHK